MRFLITGGCGFLGSNLGAEVIKRGHELFVVDNLFRFGSHLNLEWLKQQGEFTYFPADIRSFNDVERAVKESKPDVVFHLAGQVAMTTSLANPRLDFEINVLGGNNLLETVRRHAPEAIVTYSSTNKVYGDFGNLEFIEKDTRYVAKGFEDGFDENLPLNFESPYGCSKGATDQYMVDYYRMFGIRTIVFRHSSIFGGRQFSTIDQGWIGWFIKQALDVKMGRNKKPFSISGDGKQVRDVLFASDIVGCYFKAIEKITSTAGNVYNIGGGIQNSLSLLELFQYLENSLDVELKYEKLPWRQSDQKVFVANIEKANNDFQWSPEVAKEEGIENMIKWLSQPEN